MAPLHNSFKSMSVDNCFPFWQPQASQPSVPIMPRPLTPLRKSDKIPMPIRTRYLNQFIEECLIIYQSPNDAYERVRLCTLRADASGAVVCSVYSLFVFRLQYV